MSTRISALATGESGSGKTLFGSTFPKVYRIGTEPGGYETIENSPTIKNIVKNAEFIPSPLEDIKSIFIGMNEAIIEAHKLQAEGKVETLFFDNLSYLSENRWIYINQYETSYGKTGALDTQSMYGNLGRYLYQFTLMKLCSFKGNVVVSAHIKRESEEAMKKKASDDTDILPDILGGFRNQVQGMFSLVMFMHNLGEGKERKFVARVNKGKGCLAKNRYNLPDVVPNISYDTIVKAIEENKTRGRES